MDFFGVVERRRSVRSFDPDRPVSAEDGKCLLEVACRRP